MGLYRIPPALPAAAYKTYVIARSRRGRRRGTCTEAGCDAWRFGWQTIVPADSPQAEYIRHDRSRSWREERDPGGLARFTFGPGQEAFAGQHEHWVWADEPGVFLVRGGDYRGNPRQTPALRHSGFDAWANDFGDHQDKLARAQQ
jgi:hypothetical protein